MLKLLFTLTVFLALALGLLGWRMRRLELTAETARLRQQVTQREQALWSQEVPIAERSNPTALVSSLKAAGMELGQTFAEEAPPGGGMSVKNTGNVVKGDVDRDLTAPLRHGRVTTHAKGR